MLAEGPTPGLFRAASGIAGGEVSMVRSTEESVAKHGTMEPDNLDDVGTGSLRLPRQKNLVPLEQVLQ
jgi:hypothetical protein